MSRELRQYLRDPQRLFRRVRDERGHLTLSKAARAYTPGRGVYRSSYKNARRLAATETNMAYRAADWERWQGLDFVVGVEVHTSAVHGEDDRDICDELAGRYPKGFKFTGWHPHCRCYATALLKTEEEMREDESRILAGEEPTSPEESVNYEDHLPKGFTDWVDENSSRMDGAASRPYFIRDNYKDGDIAKGLSFTIAQKVEKDYSTFPKERKEAAKIKESPKEVDAILREQTGEIWQNLDDVQKHALNDYTGVAYGDINDSLRKYDANNIPDYVLDYIRNIDSVLDKTSLSQDMTFRRGDGVKGLIKFGLPKEVKNLNDITVEEIKSIILGKEGVEDAYWSCGVSTGTGYTDTDVNFEVFCPKGTKGIYSEPFSEFGDGDGINWDGKHRQLGFSYECEFLIHRGGKYRVVDVKPGTGGAKVDVVIELIGREPKKI